MNRLLVFLAVTAACSVAQADQSAFNDHGFYTEDTISGLYWLDVTETQGLSADDVIAEMVPGGRYDGWRYATKTELETMLANFGYWAHGNPCVYTGNVYCDVHQGLPGAQFYRTQEFVALFGDTESKYDAAISLTAEDPDNEYGSRGLMEHSLTPDFKEGARVIEFFSSYSGNQIRNIWSGQAASHRNDKYDAQYGSFLVRETVPSPLPPKLPTNIPGSIDFETITPADLDLQFICEGGDHTITDKGLCAGHFMLREEPYSVTPSGNPAMWLGLSSSFDRQFTPFLRVSGFDYRPLNWETAWSACAPEANAYIDAGNGRIYIDYASNAAPAPQGQGWCRVTVDSGWIWLPPLGADPDVPGVATAVAFGIEDDPTLNNTYGYFRYAMGFGFDNIVVETVDQNVIIDFDPWSNQNEMRPKDAYAFSIMIKTTRVADGDPYDFDAATVDATSLRVGPDMAPNVSLPLTADYDEDGDTDYIFGFRMEDTGITCFDNTITLSGADLSGIPIAGTDLTVPINCEEIATIDVDPWNTSNEVEPDRDYIVPVAILSTSTAQGEAADIDATQVDISSLMFGPNRTPHAGSTVVADLDNDSDTDIVVGFNAINSGIACGDTEVNMEGNIASGLPIIGVDTITTVECETGGCHP